MPELINALKRVLSRPAFLVVAAILLLAAVGLNGATEYLQLHFKKEPVPLARPLTDLPERIGPWVQVSLDEVMEHEMQEVLGTDKYVFRDYVDSRLVSKADLDEFKDKSYGERKRLVSQIQMSRPEAVINLGVTYYTGMVDTVAHIPDRCYIADGYEPTSYTEESWKALAGRPGVEKVRYIVFEDQTPGRVSITRNVAYFFNCNGEYVNDPIGVRRRLANLLQKYGYYMKIELQTLKLTKEQSAQVMDDFVVRALPEVEKCLPDWKKVTAGQAGR